MFTDSDTDIHGKLSKDYIVNIYVGKVTPSTKPIQVSARLLAYTHGIIGDWFDEVIGHVEAEGPDQIPVVHLDDEYNHEWLIFLQWRTTGGETLAIRHFQTNEQFIRLWTFGEKHEIPQLQDKVMIALLGKFED